MALYDRRRVRPSRRQAPAPEVQRILRLYRERFAGWNVRHFYRFARREHAVKLSYSADDQVVTASAYLSGSAEAGHRGPVAPCQGGKESGGD